MENGYLALELEKGIHAELKEHRLDKRLMKNYHTSSGYTECYPVALEEVLINKMQRCWVTKENKQVLISPRSRKQEMYIFDSKDVDVVVFGGGAG